MIVRVEARVIGAPIDEPVLLSFGVLRHRFMVLLEIETADGLVGYGESWVNWPPWAHVERAAAYDLVVAPELLGRDASGIAGLVEDLESVLMPMGHQAGTVGAVQQAISGVDLALWDLEGKRAGSGVAGLLGPPARHVEVYASSVGPGSNVEAVCERLVGRGFRTIKVRVGFDRDGDRELLRRVRTTVGDGVRLIADANRAWGLSDAIDMARVLRRYDVHLVEEPLVRPTMGDLERLHTRTGIKVAMGENIYSHDAFARLLASPAIGALQPDLTKNGGLTRGRLIGAAAEEAGVSLMPHCYGGPFGFVASLQLMSGAGLDGAVEYPVEPQAPFWDMLSSPPEVIDGRVVVPDGPGLGVNPHARWVEQHEQVVDVRSRVPR